MLRTLKTALQRPEKILALVAGSTVLAACTGFLQPHKMHIQQGNIVTKDMLDKLKVGMTPKQVHYVLGTPLLVDTFANDSWHYVYSLRLGNGQTLQQKLSLAFEGGKLDEINTDYKFDQPPSTKLDSETQSDTAPALSLTDKTNSAIGE